MQPPPPMKCAASKRHVLAGDHRFCDPFIGLFGTVWGIIDAFPAWAAPAPPVARRRSGIAERWSHRRGSFRCHPAVIFYNHFCRKFATSPSGWTPLL